MERDQLLKQLRATFLEELAEHVVALNRDLLDLEKLPSEVEKIARLQTLFRTVHSLKGAARSVSVPIVESACHALEEVFGTVRDGLLPLDGELFSLFFAAADGIEEAGQRLREEQALDDGPLAALLPRLEDAANEASDKQRSARSSPRLRPPPATKPAPAPPVAAPVPPRMLPLASPSAGVELRETLPVPPPAPVPQPPAAVPPAAAEALSEPAATGGTVRVLAEKLDSLFARNGELLVTRRRVQSRKEDVAGLREALGRWRLEWHAVHKLLGKSPAPHDGPTTIPGARFGLRDQGQAGHERGAGPRAVRRAEQVLRQTASRLRQLEKELERLEASLGSDGRLLEQAASALDEEVRRVRMLPFADTCQGFDRMVRDLAQAVGKEVEFVVEGGQVELDRSVLEGLKDPLRHLVRNAVDHGAEPAAERLAICKPPHARITVAAAVRGAQVEVVVTDDGRGLDLAGLRRVVRERKLPAPADDRELARLIFLPGVSTALAVTDISGRGVGMDVVKSKVEALHGTIDLHSETGRGTRFTLAVPLTLTMLRAILLRAGGQTFALIGTNVQKLVRVDPASLRRVGGRRMLPLDGTLLPVASLAQTLALPAGERAGGNARLSMVILAAGDKRLAFVVDEFIAEQEIVVKNLGPRIRRLRHVCGATILPSGRIVLVLNAANLIRGALAAGDAPSVLGDGHEPAAAVERKRIIVADDSVTTRTLERTILEAAGYEVTVAVDGQAAWQLLQERGADLVVSDVEMPRLDGFGLTETIRASERFRTLPVVLITSREAEADKARGIAAGADAYVIKSAFDQHNLLETIAQLL
jgi:two-component system chemotaxis sensor kinase CheA